MMADNSPLIQNIEKFKSNYAKSKKLLFAFCLIGAIVGFLIVYIKPTTYTSKLSFIVEESKSNVSGLASIAGQFGLDFSTTSGSNLISGENLLLFLKSSSLCKEALLTKYDSIKAQTLADVYITKNKLKLKWDKKLNQNISFENHTNGLSVLQDSLLKIIIKRILEKELFVERPEKKATFVNVSTTMIDEKLCKQFCDNLVQKAIDRYISVKTKKQKSNVDKLQKRVDSIGRVLNISTFSSAYEQEKILDLNPGSKTQAVAAEVNARDKVMLTTIYGEVVKNLELAKVSLNQETPTIQIVDPIEYPLQKSKPNYLKSIILFAFISGFIAFFLINFKIAFNIIFNNK